MKKIFLLLTAAIATVLMAEDSLTTAQLDQIQNQNVILRNPTLKIKAVQDLQSVYFLKLEAKTPRGPSQRVEAYLDKKTGALYIGDGYDKDGTKFSFPTDFKTVDEAVAFKYGSGKKELYLISDPECPYCIKFAKESEGKLKDYTVHVILFPLSFHKHSKNMINYIVAGKDDSEKEKRYKNTVIDGHTSYKDTKLDTQTLNEYLVKSYAAIYELSVDSTPSFFVKEDNSLRRVTWKEVLQK